MSARRYSHRVAVALVRGPATWVFLREHELGHEANMDFVARIVEERIAAWKAHK